LGFGNVISNDDALKHVKCMVILCYNFSTRFLFALLLVLAATIRGNYYQVGDVAMVSMNIARVFFLLSVVYAMMFLIWFFCMFSPSGFNWKCQAPSLRTINLLKFTP